MLNHNKLFLAQLDAETNSMILDSIAVQYGITPEEAFAEVTGDQAEHLLDYMKEPMRGAVEVIMERGGFLQTKSPQSKPDNHYQQLIAEEIRSIQGQKNYCLSVMATGGLDSWKSKEYSELAEQYDQKLLELNSRLIRLQLAG